MVPNLVAHFTKFDKFRKADQPLKDTLATLAAKTKAPPSTPKQACSSQTWTARPIYQGQ
jgi:hypothetical protein